MLFKQLFFTNSSICCLILTPNVALKKEVMEEKRCKEKRSKGENGNAKKYEDLGVQRKGKEGN